MSSSRLDTVIFDMDGLLLDTEPLWTESMYRIVKKYSIPINIHQFKETTGLRITEVTEHWSLHYPWQGPTHQHVADEILDDIIEAAKRRAEVMDGVLDALERLKSDHFKIGLASSSPARMIHTLIDHFRLNSFFDTITSADIVEWGKPHPAVFQACATALRSHPRHCLVLEDSVNGMIAAKAARMKVVVVPDPVHFDDPRFSVADGKLQSLVDFDIYNYF